MSPTAPAREMLDPADTALLLFDMLERARPDLESAGVLAPARRLLDVCREVGVLVCYARADHRADGAEFATTLTDVDPAGRLWSLESPQPRIPADPGGSPALRVVPELAPEPRDIDVPKHRWSAFRGTVLDVVLRAQGRRTLLVCGGSTHVGVASTVYAARDLDYQVVVVRDCCSGRAAEREFFLDRVFPRVCRVRTAAEVEAMLTRPR